jgi:hypothetical protein
MAALDLSFLESKKFYHSNALALGVEQKDVDKEVNMVGFPLPSTVEVQPPRFLVLLCFVAL